MGIKDFYKQIRTKYPDCFTPVHYSQFRFNKMAIDMMNIMYVFRARSERDWLKLLLEFITKLRSYQIHTICIFDGQSHPLKQQTVQKRRDDRERGKARVNSLRESIELYKNDGIISETLQKFIDTHEEFVSKLTSQPLIVQIGEHVEKMYKNCNIHFRTSDVDAVREILTSMGVTVLVAENDGEALCSYLSMENKVDLILSNDSDVFFFGGEKVIFKFNDEGGYLVSFQDILSKLEFTKDQFVDMCLLCGTDFNNSVRGIGFCKAYNLIKDYSSIHNPSLPIKHQLDFELLSSIRDMVSTETYIQIPFCKPPNTPLLQQLLFKYQIQTSPQIFEAFPSQIILEEN